MSSTLSTLAGGDWIHSFCAMLWNAASGSSNEHLWARGLRNSASGLQSYRKGPCAGVGRYLSQPNGAYSVSALFQ